MLRLIKTHANSRGKACANGVSLARRSLSSKAILKVFCVVIKIKEGEEKLSYNISFFSVHIRVISFLITVLFTCNGKLPKFSDESRKEKFTSHN
jgi:hypothetical protein